MTTVRTQPRGILSVLALLALIAMTIRAIVPVGVMLTPDPDRLVVVTLCSGAGPLQMTVNLDTGVFEPGDTRASHDQDDDKPAPHASCVFASVAALAPPVALAGSIPTLAPAERAAPAFPEAVAIGQGLAAPPPWATGPPLAA